MRMSPPLYEWTGLWMVRVSKSRKIHAVIGAEQNIGSVLMTASAAGNVRFWKESLDGQWVEYAESTFS